MNRGLILSSQSGRSVGKMEVALELIPTFRSLLDCDVLKGTTGQPSVGRLRAITLLSRSEVIRGFA